LLEQYNSTYLKFFQLQRKDEICLSVICSENRKNERNSLWLNPKGGKNGKSAAKPQIEESSTTIENTI